MQLTFWATYFTQGIIFDTVGYEKYNIISALKLFIIQWEKGKETHRNNLTQIPMKEGLNRGSYSQLLSSSDTLACFWFLEHTKLIPASEPLYLLFLFWNVF